MSKSAAISKIEGFDLAELPGWLRALVALARPGAVTMLVAIPAAGAFTVGAVAFWLPETAIAMAEASTTFLAGIPEPAWWVIATISVGYSVSKSAEVIKAPPPPAGRASPETGGGDVDRPTKSPASIAAAPANPAGVEGGTPMMELE